MNSFDRFSRNYIPQQVLTASCSSETDEPPRRERAASEISSVSRRSVYRLSGDVEIETSCVSVADRSLPPPLAQTRLASVSFHSSDRAAVSPTAARGLAGLTLPQIERLAFLETLVACRGCRRLAARKLGVSEKTMYNKIKQYKLAAELERLATAEENPS